MNEEYAEMTVGLSRGNDSSLSSLYSACFLLVSDDDGKANACFKDTLQSVDIPSTSLSSAVAVLGDKGWRGPDPFLFNTPLQRLLVPPRRFLNNIEWYLSK